MINLSKEDTYKLLYFENRLASLKKRFKFKTLHKWWCLNCRKEIFVRYDSIGIPNIFCTDDECASKAKNPSIVAMQYLKRLKEEQLKLFDNIK